MLMRQLPHSQENVSYSVNIESTHADDLSWLEQKSLSSLKTSFIHWIRSLPMEERFLALKIYSAPIPQILRKTLYHLGLPSYERGSQIHAGKNQSVPKAETIAQPKRTLRKIQKGFYESLVFISDGHNYIDHICFEFGLLECPQKLFDLLLSPIQNPSPKCLAEIMKDRMTIEQVCQKLLKCQTLETLAITTIDFLRNQIFLRLRTSMQDADRLSRDLQEQRRRKKQFSAHLKHLSEDLKRKMIMLGCKDLQELHLKLTSLQINLSCPQLQREISELLKLQKNQFSNRIFKCKLKKSISQLVSYYEQIYLYWKKEAIKSRKKKGGKTIGYEKLQKQKQVHKQQVKMSGNRSRKNKQAKSSSLQSNQTNVTECDQKNQKKRTLAQHQHNPFFSPKVEEKKKQIETQHEISDITLLESKKKLHKKRKGKDDRNCDSVLEKRVNKQIKKNEQQQYTSTPSCNSELQYQLVPPQTIKKLSMDINQMKDLSLSSITQQMQQFADKISQQANQYHDRRIIAFERIQFLLSYYYVNIELFGSCASGIAIKNSDIDIAVKSQILNYFEYVPDRLRLQAALENLTQIFSTQPYISEINFISTASIPIIKLKVDTSIGCLDPQYGQLWTKLNRPHNSGIVEADITIETLNVQSQSSHLGIISTQAINQWLEQIPTLHYVVLTLKFYLQSRGLHKTYAGGMNTFSMIVLIVAFIYHAKLQDQTNPALVMQKLLRFYAYQFDEKQTGIDLLNRGVKEIYFKKQNHHEVKQGSALQKADLQILDPKCQGKNITRKCYLFPQIKKFFKEILEKCFDRPYQQLEQMVTMEEIQSCNLSYFNPKKLLKNKGNRFELLLQNL